MKKVKENKDKQESGFNMLFKLTQQVPGVLYQYRYHKDGRNYFPYASEKIGDVYEVTPDQVKNDATLVLSRLHPSDYDLVVNSITESFETLEVWSLKYRVVLPKKGLRWLHGQAQPEKLEDDSVLWHGFIQDITESHEAEIALSISNKRWKFALEGAKDGVWDWNLKTDEVYFSSQWKAMLGFKDDEIKGSLEEWSKRVHPDDMDACYADIKKHLDREVDVYSNVHRVLCKNGSYIWVLDRGKVVETDDEGNPVRMVGTHTDLTERVEMEKLLLEKNKELEQFNYIASHDLQEPLNSIISFSGFLEDERDKLSELGVKSVEVIKASAYRMKDFIISLLDLSRIGRQKKKKEVDIQQLIETLKSDLHSLITKKQASIYYVGKPLKIMAFEADLIKLFQNLVVNSIKYTDGKVTPFVVIDVEVLDDKYKFSVADNGIGIPEKYFDKIFKMFERLHAENEYSGTGIGLSYCKKVVELHKGEIWLESEEGKGSTFYFTIPK